MEHNISLKTETVFYQRDHPLASVRKDKSKANRKVQGLSTVRRVPLLLASLLLTFFVFPKVIYASTEKVNLAFTSVSIGSWFENGNNLVSATTGLHVDITRMSVGSPWKPNQCFELTFTADYFLSGSAEPLYKTFSAANPPSCTSEGKFEMKCNLKKDTWDTVQFTFTKFMDSAELDKRIEFHLGNFKNPYSSVLVRSNMRWYSDADCTENVSSQGGTDLSFYAKQMQESQVQLLSSTNTVGFSELDNELILKFTPDISLAPTGRGTIQMSIPEWYSIGNGAKSAYMYDEGAINACISFQLTIQDSHFGQGQLRMHFIDVANGYLIDKEIVVRCKGFRNPIYPDKWTGFTMHIYDYTQIGSSVSQNLISWIPNLVFDTTRQKPAIFSPQKFTVTLSDPKISQPSNLIINIDVPTPLDIGCFIKLILPSDLSYTDPAQLILVTKLFKGKNLNSKIGSHEFCDSAEPSTPSCKGFDMGTGQVGDNQYWIFSGCNDANALGQAPSGRLIYADFFAPRAIKTSEPFNIEIYKDMAFTQLIAKSEIGSPIKAQDIIAGIVTAVSMKPEVGYVQTVTTMQVSFTSANYLDANSMVQINMPDNLILPASGTEFTLKVRLGPLGDEGDIKGKVISDNQEIRLYDILGWYKGAISNQMKFEFYIPGIKTQLSTKDAGPWQIFTYLKYDDVYYTVDEGHLNESFIALAGQIKATNPIVVSDPIVYGKDSTYTLTFSAEHDVPKFGHIEINLPIQVWIEDATLIDSAGSCLNDYKCVFSQDLHQLFMELPYEAKAGHQYVINIAGVRNPRTFAATDSFNITVYDQDKASIIDSGFDSRTAMEIATKLESTLFTPASDINGNVTTYTFTFQTSVPILPGDIVSFEFPNQVMPPSTGELMNCTGTANIKKMSCAISDDQAIATISEVEHLDIGGIYKFTIQKVKNPYSTQKSDGFTNLQLKSNEDYLIAALEGETVGITNKQPAAIRVYETFSDEDQFSSTSILHIKFDLINSIPHTAAIKLSYPEQLTLEDGELTFCRVVAYEIPQGKENCNINVQARTITVTDAFGSVADVWFKGSVMISLSKVQLPATNIKRGSYTIKTFSEHDMTYLVDELATEQLLLNLQCNWPCEDCLISQGESGKSCCTDCWQMDETTYPAYFFLPPKNDTCHTCKTKCPFGYSPNAALNNDKHCAECDQSCIGCKTSSTFDCINCNAPEFPFRYNGTDLCNSECGVGWYEYNPVTCNTCNSPCMDCSSDRCCTLCDQDSALSVLFDCQCIHECPSGYTNVNGKCLPCEAPCLECNLAVDLCTVCDAPCHLLINSTCYCTCPDGTVPNYETSKCEPCTGIGCLFCKLDDKEFCMDCAPPLVLLGGACVNTCGDGLVVDLYTRACRKWELSDLGVIYFPFLSCTAVFTILVIYGRFKTKAVLVKGKVTHQTHQSSIPAILAFIGPIQALAVVTQWIFASVYDTNLHTFLGMAVTLVIIILSIVQVIAFHNRFLGYRLTKEAKDKVKRGRLTSKQAWAQGRYIELKDPRFRAWQKKHLINYWVTAIFSGTLSWKINKLYYSRLYSQSVYTAYWTRAKDYRNFVYYYTLVNMVFVDLFLVCIGIPGLIEIHWGNQLYITLIETVTLSIINIALSAYELYRLQDYLKYTMKNEKNWNNQVRVSSGFNDAEVDSEDEPHSLDRKGREKTMQRLIQKVKYNQDTNLNGALEDLLNGFGRRKYKSCMILDQELQQEIIPDPRGELTWPTTPRTYLKYSQMKIKFTEDDKYGLKDNCYYESVIPPPVKDKGIGGDPIELTFQAALSRKGNELVSARGEPELSEDRFSKTKRRGRKNKYYGQIDQEDEEEVDAIESNIQTKRDNDQQLRITQIKEEESLKAQLAEQQKQSTNMAKDKRRSLEQTQAQKIAADKAATDLAKIEAQKERQEKLERDKIEKERALREESERLERIRAANEELKMVPVMEKQKQDQLAATSELARLQYEVAEADRLRKEADKAAVEATRQLVEERARADAERSAKEALLDALRAEQTKADQAGFAQKKESQVKEDNARLMEKLALADTHEKLRVDNLAKEQQEREQILQVDAVESAQRKQERDTAAKQQAEIRAAQIAKQQAEKDAPTRQTTPQDQQISVSPIPNDPKHQILNQSSQLKSYEPAKANQQKIEAVIPPSQPLKAAQAPTQIAQKQLSTQKSLEMIVELKQDALKPFLSKADPIIETPPQPFSCLFNELDILGEVDRDQSGHVVPPTRKDQTGKFLLDKKKQPCNVKGYLVNTQNGDIVNNMDGQIMFAKEKLFQKTGDLTEPFFWDKHNFNPQSMLGDFDYQKQGQPRMLKTNKGFCVDKKGRRVNKHGWLEQLGQAGSLGENQPTGRLVDSHGRPKFDKRQSIQEGDLPKLFTLSGKKFDIKDVMGQFDRDSNNNIVFAHATIMTPVANEETRKDLKDLRDRRVNEKGYLCDQSGNIVDCNGKLLFQASTLTESGDFPKIFAFTKFVNLKHILGEFDQDSKGKLILLQTGKDKRNRFVNAAGYLIDTATQNVIDDMENPVLPARWLDADGEIPAVFRSGQLQTSQSQISQVSSLVPIAGEMQPSINNNNFNNNNNRTPADQLNPQNLVAVTRDPSGRTQLQNSRNSKALPRDYNTSVDSRMEDTPANYNLANQRLDTNDEEGFINPILEDENAEHLAFDDQPLRRFQMNQNQSNPVLQNKLNKKKKGKGTTVVEFLAPTRREENMAGAYGGAARGQVRRQGIKYNMDRLTHSKKFLVSQREEPLVRAELERLAKSVAGFNIRPKPGTTVPGPRRHNLIDPEDRERMIHGKSEMSDNKSDDNPNQQSPLSRHMDQEGKENPIDKIRNKGAIQVPGRQAEDDPFTQNDFKRIFGKGIEQFLEDSDWDEGDNEENPAHIANQVSHFDMDPQAKLNAMEKAYNKKSKSRKSIGFATESGFNQSMVMRPNTQGTKSDSRIGQRNVRRSYNDSKMNKMRSKPMQGPPRETIISYTNDPGVIYRGEILPFETLKKKDMVVNKGPQASGIGIDSQSHSRSASYSPERRENK